MKDEKSSNNYTKVSKAALDKVNPDSSIRKALQKVLIASNTRDISRQECFLLLSKKHDFVTFSLATRNCSVAGGRSVPIQHLKTDDSKLTKDDGYFETYCNREKDPNFQRQCEEYEEDPQAYRKKAHKNYATVSHPKETTLHEYLAFHEKNWHLSNTEHIPVVSPKFLRVPKSNQKQWHELYCRARLLQFKPGATPANLLSAECDTFAKAMKEFIKDDPACPNLLKEEFSEAQVEEKTKSKEDGDDANQDDEEYDENGEDDGEDDDANGNGGGQDNDAMDAVFPDLFPGDNSNTNFLHNF